MAQASGLAAILSHHTSADRAGPPYRRPIRFFTTQLIRNPDENGKQKDNLGVGASRGFLDFRRGHVRAALDVFAAEAGTEAVAVLDARGLHDEACEQAARAKALLRPEAEAIAKQSDDESRRLASLVEGFDPAASAPRCPPSSLKGLLNKTFER